MTGRFVVFEGGEGCGKSTQAERLASELGAVLTREPGGTAVGGRIRDLVLGPGTALHPRAETLLIAADRAQHVAEVVRPALESGRHVVSDRYVGSSLAYQGVGRGLGVDEVRRLSEWATGGLWPDLVVFLEVPAEEVARRTASHTPDRMESAGGEFHAAVAEGFRSLAAADPAWVAVDGTGTVDAVAGRVRSVVSDRLGL